MVSYLLILLKIYIYTLSELFQKEYLINSSGCLIDFIIANVINILKYIHNRQKRNNKRNNKANMKDNHTVSGSNNTSRNTIFSVLLFTAASINIFTPCTLFALDNATYNCP